MSRVTVLMPVYNGEAFLREAIDSILQQTWTDFEFLIVNDGSQDGSRDIISSYEDPRVRLIDNPVNMGQTASLNRGLKLGKGDFIARLDQDDLSQPERLEKQITFLDKNPSVALLGTGFIGINQDNETLHSHWPRLEENNTDICWALLFDNIFTHSSVMFRRDVVWQELSGYDESIVVSQDYDLWSKIARRYETHILNQPLVSIRSHGSNASGNYNFDSEVYPIILENLRHFLQDDNISPDWAHIIYPLSASSGLDNFSPKIFEILDHIYARFCQLYPEAKDNLLIRHRRAQQFGHIARRASLCLDRKSSLRAVARSLRLDARALEWDWLIKWFGLWVGGKLARDFYWHRRKLN